MSDGKLSAGDSAPDFTLTAHDEEEVKLSDFAGQRVLLSFHPLAWTSVCRNQMSDLEANYQTFKEENVVPLGISVDPQPSKKAWAEDLRLENLKILSDFWPHGDVAGKYGLFREEDGISERANVLIDEEGKIEFIKIYSLGELPDIEELIEAVKA